MVGLCALKSRSNINDLVGRRRLGWTSKTTNFGVFWMLKTTTTNLKN
uniref:Uncharacterized protein n=1 Tax=Cucumis melo TaxID=3656 RepID=A0A9I9E571_CUCME